MSDEKIDIVITWLNNKDPKWQHEYKKAIEEEGIIIDDKKLNNDARFRDYETLRYWFRSVEKYAPWVHKIFLVTFGHFPEWIASENPRLVLVKHEDFIPKEYLPTFSSVTIGLNLHRIPDISEQFIWFDDDMFLNNITKPTDFFKKGQPCDMLALVPLQSYEAIGHLNLNNMILIHRHFSKSDILKNSLKKMIGFHTSIPYLGTTLLQLPYPKISNIMFFHLAKTYTKSIYKEVWDLDFESLDMACKRKFRSEGEVGDLYIRLYYLCKGEFSPKNMYRFGKMIELATEFSKLEKLFHSKRKVLCLNDTQNMTNEMFPKVMVEVHRVLQQKFPEKSKYEM
jgi:hypothetical protein